MAVTQSKTSATYSIRNFFADKGVLITGATGLVGKGILEKILRDLPLVRQIFVLIRPRARPNGSLVDPAERLQEEVLANPAFNRLRRSLGAKFESWCRERVTCVPGDVTRDNLGLDRAHYEALARQIQVVIHPAATVNFTELLDTALEMNTLGPLRLLEFSRQAGATYIPISTAYVCGNRSGLVAEQILDPLQAIDAQLPPGAPRPKEFSVADEIGRLREQCRSVEADWEVQIRRRGWAPDSEEARTMRKRALIAAGMRRARSLGWNDIYTYTKFLGEQLIKRDQGQVPVAIIRTAIIESSLRDPEPGWLNDLRVADPLIVGFGKGRLMDFPANRRIILDLIPADLVVNAILAAAAWVGGKPGAFELIHVASSSENPLVFEKMYQIVRDYFEKHPMLDRGGKPVRVPHWKFPSVERFKRQVQNRYLRPMKVANALMSGPLPIPGTGPWRTKIRSMNVVMEQLLDYVDKYSFYTNLDCRFETVRSRAVLEAMAPGERLTFDFDPSKIRWRHYLQEVHIPGLKRNILRMEGTGRAVRTHPAAAGTREGAPEHRTIHGTPQTVVELVARGADHYGNKPFLEIRRAASGLTQITYAQFKSRSANWARLLRARLDLAPGERVAIWMENCPEWCLAWLAVVQAGGVAVPLDRQLSARQLLLQLRQVEAKAVITSAPMALKAEEALRAGGSLPPLLDAIHDLEPLPGYQWSSPQAAPEEVRLPDPAPEDLAAIFFTSGTTGTPKGVMLSHANLLNNAISTAEVLVPMPDDQILSVLPLHYAFEFTGGFLVPMLSGSTIHHVESLRMPVILETMRRAGITVVLGVPRLYQHFVKGIQAQLAPVQPARTMTLSVLNSMADAADLVGGETARKRFFSRVHEMLGGKLRMFISGGEALDPELFHFFRRLGIVIVEGYGLTETSPVLTANPVERRRPGSVGRPLPGVELRIRHPDEQGCGEIQVRGPMVMQGYWQSPEATERSFHEGWLGTGDFGRLDADGYLYLAGRKEEIILLDGRQRIFPDEVEAHFQRLQGVTELSVLGLPARFGKGQEVALVIVPGPQASHQAISQEIERLNQRLPKPKQVTRIEKQRGVLPRTSSGKVQRYVIEARCRAQASSSAVRLPRVAAEGSREETRRMLLEQVRRSLAEIAKLPLEELDLEKDLERDLKLDAMARVDLLGKIELRLNLALGDELLGRALSVKDVLDAAEAAFVTAGHHPQGEAGAAVGEQGAGDLQPQNLQPASLSRTLIQGAFKTTAKVLFNTWLSIGGDGLEHLPASGSYILASNHSSHLDIVAVREVLGRNSTRLFVMAARDYFFDERLKSWFLTNALNLLPMDRDRISPDDIRRCCDVLEHGNSLLIFPEATRSLSGKIQNFKSAIGILATELRFPILPVYISGTYQALPKGSSIPRPAHVRVRIGQEVELTEVRKKRLALEERDGGLNWRPPGSSHLYREAAGLVQEAVERLAKTPPRLGGACD